MSKRLCYVNTWAVNCYFHSSIVSPCPCVSLNLYRKYVNETRKHHVLLQMRKCEHYNLSSHVWVTNLQRDLVFFPPCIISVVGTWSYYVMCDKCTVIATDHIVGIALTSVVKVYNWDARERHFPTSNLWLKAFLHFSLLQCTARKRYKDRDTNLNVQFPISNFAL